MRLPTPAAFAVHFPHPRPWRIAHRSATADPSRVRRSLAACIYVETCSSLCECRPKPRSPFTCSIHVRGELLIALRLPTQAAFAVHLPTHLLAYTIRYSPTYTFLPTYPPNDRPVNVLTAGQPSEQPSTYLRV